MYIPEFWCGVCATIIAELAGLIIVVVYAAAAGKGKGGQSDS